MPAQMTTQSSVDRRMPMKRERDAAIWAVARFATIAAKQRCGAARIHDALLDLRPHDCDIAGMIPWRFLLFVGRLVFLIHDDQPEIFQRCEDRAARADHNAGAAGMNLVPLVVTLSFGKMT